MEGRRRAAAIVAAAMAMMMARGITGQQTGDGGKGQTWNNITSVLVGAGYLDNFVSLVTETGADDIFQKVADKASGEMDGDETAGVTILAPIDKAFDEKTQRKLANLSAEQKLKLVLFHALPVWYPIGNLQEESHVDEPTIATTFNSTAANIKAAAAAVAAKSYLLNITHNTGKVSIATSLSKANYTSAYYTQQPLSVVAITALLLPPELFLSSPPPPPPASSSAHHILSSISQPFVAPSFFLFLSLPFILVFVRLP